MTSILERVTKKVKHLVAQNEQSPQVESTTPISPEQALRRQIAWHYLSGKGIEIGALHSPLEVPPHAQVHYVDRLSVAELRKQYPELAEHELVEVDIIDDGETLPSMADASVDFVIANHMIEHCQDPIGTIEHHLRVLKPVRFCAKPESFAQL
ncbi:MAG: class I SAM-dependent methyltransferase [Symploca sp. SIO2E6]|nr:class I SAM-dependent methyltransferase [Symploca sp. SIO2E6]